MSIQMETSPRQLEQQIERLVRSRTGGTIRELQIDVRDEEVVLFGRASTYYSKQLATHAALNAIEHRVLTNAIEVF